MKKALLLIGLIVGTVLLGAAIYVGYGYLNASLYLQRARHLATEQIEQSQQGNPQPAYIIPAHDGKPAQPMYRATYTSTPPIANPDGYSTEDDWIAASIAQEIAEMAFVATNGQEPLPAFKVGAKVDSAKPSVHVEISGAPGGAQTADLTPRHAWDVWAKSFQRTTTGIYA